MSTIDAYRLLPKVLLHEHLDGGLRPATLFELLEDRGIDPPAPTVAALEAWFDDHAHAGSLEAYLEGFGLTCAAMASPRALERVAFEAAEDAHRDGCVLAEFRIAPLLFEPLGVDPDATMEALLAGLARAASATGMPCGLIVCGMRQHSAAEVARSAELALRYRPVGAIGFDLAGPEAGYPPSLHAGALARLRERGMPLTLHAGEADAAERVLEAIELGATRIGHGVRLVDALGRPDDNLIPTVRARDVHLEVCPTSNVHTGAATSIATHPIRALWDAGVSLSYHTDNRLMSRISLSDEARDLVDEAGFTTVDLVAMARAAARHTFLPAAARDRALARIDRWSDAA